MLAPPRPAMVGGLIWILACAVWLVLAARKASTRGAAGSHGYPGRYPGLLLNGIALIALAPVVSAVQYLASRQVAFWGGACVLFVGLVLIIYHLLLARRSADWASRPAVTTFREKGIVVQIVSILAALAELVRLGSQLVYYRLDA